VSRGWANQTTKQVGEYLVAAELSRIGFISTPFAGSVPHYDILATNESGRIIAVQVKAIRGQSWQFDLRKFAAVRLDGKRQIVEGANPEPYPRLWCVLVALGDARSEDRFYVLRWKQLCDIIVRKHRAYLHKHGGVRPKRHDSYHTALKTEDLEPHRGKWDPIRRLCGV